MPSDRLKGIERWSRSGPLALISLLLVATQALCPSLTEYLPKPVLSWAAVLFAVAFAVSLAFLFDLRWKHRLTFKFGVKWDHGNPRQPHCPTCETYLSDHVLCDKASSFFCGKCKIRVPLKDERGNPVTLKSARASLSQGG